MTPATDTPEHPANTLLASGTLHADQPVTRLRLDTGEVLEVPTATLLQGMRSGTAAPTQAAAPASEVLHEVMIPVLAENLNVERREVITDTIRLTKRSEPFTQSLDEVLHTGHYTVDRIACDQVLDARPAVRQEGDTTIYPVVEEVAVVTRRFRLLEEVRVTLHQQEHHDTRSFTLQREQVSVEHVAPKR